MVSLILLFYNSNIKMKFNIGNPQSGQQKCIEIDDENKYRSLFDKRMGA